MNAALGAPDPNDALRNLLDRPSDGFLDGLVEDGWPPGKSPEMYSNVPGGNAYEPDELIDLTELGRMLFGKSEK